jgi:type I restriction enzyme, S subunit
MKSVWIPTKLSELLIPTSRSEAVDSAKEYRLLGIRLEGAGPFHRETKLGSQTSASTLFQVKAGDFIYSRLFAWRGAFGIIDDKLDGCYVSGEFPAFKPIDNKLDINFLRLWFRLPSIISKVEADCTGSTPLTRNRFKEHFFLAMEIPLPPFSEQRRIIARIDELSAKIEMARELRQQLETEYEELCRSIIFDKSAGSPTRKSMRELLKLREPDITVNRESTYHFAGVYSFGRGVFRGQLKSGAEFAYNRLTRLQSGNFVYPKLMAWEGALGVVPPECDSLVVSPEFPVFEVDQTCVLPEVLDVYFRTPSVWPLLADTSTGTNVRRRRLHPSNFLAFEMPLPPMSAQERLREVRAGINKIRPLKKEVATELDALMPAILDRAFKGELC